MLIQLLACALFVTPPQDGGPIAFVGARLIPIEGPEIANGVLVVKDGVIAHVGPTDVTPIPVGAEVRDVGGLVIMPGLVDTHSHIGDVSGGDSTDPIQPDVRVMDSINVLASGFQRAQAGGITTANLMPGSGHLCSGQTVYLKLRDGKTIDDFLVRDADGWIAGGLKMANGTNSRRDPPFPGTRAKSAALMRAEFIAAREYQKKIARAEGDPEKMPPRDLGQRLEPEVLAGKRIVHHHTHRHDDILTVLRLQSEFGFRVVLHHVSDAWKVADEIAAAGAPCSIIVVDSPGGKLEMLDIGFANGAALERAGVLVAFHTDDGITDSRLFLRSAALAVRAGMSPEQALAGVTLAAAEMLDLQDRIGSLKAGKDADFMILDGDPLSIYTKVLETWVEGERVFDRSDPRDLLWAVGGYGAGEPRTPYSCCGGGWEGE
ncbi:MAG: amidohydrolase family protein [Planctomycetota bacterium]|nr:amidohydrolase family protein [Planctomycetota bacterium]